MDKDVRIEITALLKSLIHEYHLRPFDYWRNIVGISAILQAG